MAKNFFTLLIFPIAVAFIGGCSPVGSLLGDSGSVDFIRVEPHRFVYQSEEDDKFIPVDDVEVFGIFGGTERQLTIEEIIKEVEIKISEYSPQWDEGEDEDVIFTILSEEEKEKGKQLTPGVKNVSISYRGKEAHYRISAAGGDTKPDVGGGGFRIPVNKDDWQ